MSIPEIPGAKLTSFLGSGSTGEVYTSEEKPKHAFKILQTMAVNRKILEFAYSKLETVPPHENVAQVYDFDLRGRPYHFSTELMVNKVGKPNTLDRLFGAIGDEEAWRLMMQIAEGLSFLHKHGIPHCNLKPNNVLLTTGKKPTVKLTDFSQGWVDDIHLMEPNEVYLYIPPEQLRDPSEREKRGIQWDVYAFGVLAFQLLHNKFPRLDGYMQKVVATKLENGTIGVEAEQMADKLESAPKVTWPTAAGSEFGLKRRNVLEKCLALDPENRYYDIREVVDDLAKIQHEEEVANLVQGHKSEVSNIEEIREEEKRRLRQKILRISSIAAVLLLLFGAMVYFFVKENQKRLDAEEKKRKQEIDAKRKIANARKDKEGAQRDRDTKVRVARQKQIEAELAKDKAMDEVRKSFRRFYDLLEQFDPKTKDLEMAQDYLIAFLSTYNDEPSLAMERAKAHIWLGRIEDRIGSFVDGEAEYRAGLEVLSAMKESEPDRRKEVVKQFCLVKRYVAANLLKQNRFKDAEEALRASTEAYEKIAEPGDLEIEREIAYNDLLIGEVLIELQRDDEAVKLLEKTVEKFVKFEKSNDATDQDTLRKALCYFQLGELVRATDEDVQLAAGMYSLADEALHGLVKKHPGTDEYRFHWARNSGGLGHAADEAGQHQDARIEQEAAVALLADLCKHNTENKTYQFHMALRCAALATLLRDKGESTAALEKQRTAVDLLESLHEERPDDKDYTFSLAKARGQLADFHGDKKKLADEITELLAAVKLLEDLIAKPVGNRKEYSVKLAEFYGSLGHAYQRAGKKDHAKRYFGDAKKSWEGLTGKYPDDSVISRGLTWVKDRMKRL